MQLSLEKELKYVQICQSIDRVQDKEKLRSLLKELVRSYLVYEQMVQDYARTRARADAQTLFEEFPHD